MSDISEQLYTLYSQWFLYWFNATGLEEEPLVLDHSIMVSVFIRH
ncbi:MAG: hypothetical protein ACTSO5_10560 [Candidatus Heimdallarchaeaceae archaeon]